MSHEGFGSHNDTGETFLIVRETETSNESQTKKLEMPAPVWEGQNPSLRSKASDF